LENLFLNLKDKINFGGEEYWVLEELPLSKVPEKKYMTDSDPESVSMKIEYEIAIFKIHTLLINTPLEDLPLMVNDEDTLTEELAKWRLKQGQ
jgi:hypothetical protein